MPVVARVLCANTPWQRTWGYALAEPRPNSSHLVERNGALDLLSREGVLCTRKG